MGTGVLLGLGQIHIPLSEGLLEFNPMLIFDFAVAIAERLTDSNSYCSFLGIDLLWRHEPPASIAGAFPSRNHSSIFSVFIHS